MAEKMLPKEGKGGCEYWIDIKERRGPKNENG